MLTPFQSDLFFLVTVLTFHSEDLFFGSFRVFPEHRFWLPSITSQFHMVSSLTQCFGVPFTGFVLCDLVLCMSLAFLVLAECSPDFRNVHHILATT